MSHGGTNCEPNCEPNAKTDTEANTPGDPSAHTYPSQLRHEPLERVECMQPEDCNEASRAWHQAHARQRWQGLPHRTQ